jgi:hypothetical protein
MNEFSLLSAALIGTIPSLLTLYFTKRSETEKQKNDQNFKKEMNELNRDADRADSLVNLKKERLKHIISKTSELISLEHLNQLNQLNQQIAFRLVAEVQLYLDTEVPAENGLNNALNNYMDCYLSNNNYDLTDTTRGTGLVEERLNKVVLDFYSQAS